MQLLKFQIFVEVHRVCTCNTKNNTINREAEGLNKPTRLLVPKIFTLSYKKNDATPCSNME